MEIKWTEEELKEFDGLVEMKSSRNQLDRIHARMYMPKFIEKHGKQKCDAMWNFLESGHDV